MARQAGQRKSASLRLVEGNRGHRPIPKNPQPALVMPRCPQWLSPIAKTEWKRIGPALFKLQLLHREDMAAFASYCENYAILTQCTNHIKKKGGYAKYLEDTNSQTAPHLAAQNKAFDKVRAFAREFGMTPDARGRIDIKKPANDDDEDLD